MDLKKVIGWLLVIVAIIWIINDPGGASNFVQNILDFFVRLGRAFGSFLSGATS